MRWKRAHGRRLLWMPCDTAGGRVLLAAGTTAIGLLSLAVSEIVPVKMFGIYASTGMAASLAGCSATAPGRPDRLATRARPHRVRPAGTVEPGA